MSFDSLLRSDTDELLRKAASELRKQLETGQEGRAETILSAFPALASDPHRAVLLIVLEYQLRRELGQNPDPHLWYERFPQWRDQLRRHLEKASVGGLEASQRETAALGTESYVDANQRTGSDFDLDAPVLGRHEMLEEIGRGGMGVVYRAYDQVLNRIVALKVIRSGNLASAEEVRFFYREARSAAQLHHPNIVPIYGMGLHQGQHCFTMALFPRGSLNQHLEDYLRDIRAAVGLTAKVARAVQAAHERGIIHRDLKPGNILLDERGEPVVSDFGLAKQLDAAVTQTPAEHAIGTPAYMAPEQVRCEAATKASDIWSLGVILYELLAGSRPFTGNSEGVKQNVLQTDPLSPRRLRSEVPRDLETIVLKCLAKEQTQRFGSAAALAEELERWLAGEPIRTRPESRWQRLKRRMAAKPVVRWSMPTWLLLALLLLGTGAIGVWTFFAFFSSEAQEQRRQNQILAALQHELEEGRSVTLVDSVGPPKWYRWRTQKGRAPLPEVRRWPLKLESVDGLLLLELLPDPQHDSYRFSAEVKLYGPEAEIGLCFAGEELALPTGRTVCFGLFRLVFKHFAVKAAELRFVGYCEQDIADSSVYSEIPPAFYTQPGFIPRIPPPPAVPSQGEPWRRIEVHVSPATVKAFCDGVLMGEYEVSKEQENNAKAWRATHPAPLPVPAFPARGFLGLYITDGPGYYRNVVVEPLP